MRGFRPERFHLGKCLFSRALHFEKVSLVVHTKYLLFFMVCFLPSMLVHNWGGAAALMHQQQSRI